MPASSQCLNPMSRADRIYDISLRILMLAITAALVGAVGVLIVRWNQPPADKAPAVPVTQVEPKQQAAPSTQVTTASSSEVLVAPGQVFRCESGGTVTFTDRPCPTTTR
jgi:hypothetical protein